MRVCSEINGVHCLSTTELGKRLGVHVSSTLLAEKICAPFAVTGNGVFWAVSDLDKIRKRLAILILEGA